MRNLNLSERNNASHPSTDDILRLARILWNRNPEKVRSTQTEDVEFRATFGCHVLIVRSIYKLLYSEDLLPEGGKLEHLLWALMFLKIYAGFKDLASRAGVDEQTFKKWSWLFVLAIANLESIMVSVLFL